MDLEDLEGLETDLIHLTTITPVDSVDRFLITTMLEEVSEALVSITTMVLEVVLVVTFSTTITAKNNSNNFK